MNNNPNVNIILGNNVRNKWCAFCKYWHNPESVGVTPRLNPGMFSVNKNRICTCTKKGINTKALFTCSNFTRK